MRLGDLGRVSIGGESRRIKYSARGRLRRVASILHIASNRSLGVSHLALLTYQYYCFDKRSQQFLLTHRIVSANVPT